MHDSRHGPRGHRLGLLIGLALMSSAGATLEGQEVRGRVLEGGSATPILGALVSLILGGGEVVARDLTDVGGGYSLTAVAGSYSLRVERIGFKTWSSDSFVLSVGEVVSRELQVETEAIRLPDLIAATTNRCLATPADVPAVNVVWEEARKALKSLAITERSGDYRFQVTRGTRLLDNPTLIPIDSTVYATLGWTRKGPPFAAIPAERLAEEGYVAADGQGYVFYGPDALTLLSDAFVATHCFRLRYPPRGSQRRWIGLGFEAARTDGKTDIDGVLWLDEETAEVTRLEFTHADAPGRIVDASLGGNVSLTRLADGAWVVNEWSLRVPNVHGNAVMWADAAGRPVSSDEFDIRETWGSLVGLAPGPDAIPSSTLVRGQVTQMFRGRRMPVGGATVAVPGTPYRALTRANGRFELYLSGDGPQAVEITAPPSRDSVGESVVVDACTPRPCELGLDPFMARRLLHDACDPARPETLAVTGRIASQSGDPIPEAYVQLAGPDVKQTIADADGWFFLCSGRAGEAQITVSVSGHQRMKVSVDLDPASPIQDLLVTLRPCRLGSPMPGEVVSCVAQLPVPP